MTHEEFISNFINDPSQVPVGAKCRRLEVRLNDEGLKSIYNGSRNLTDYISIRGSKFIRRVGNLRNDNLESQVRRKLSLSGAFSISDGSLYEDKMITAAVRVIPTGYLLSELVFYVDASHFDEDSHFIERCGSYRGLYELTTSSGPVEVSIDGSNISFLKRDTLIPFEFEIASNYRTGFYTYSKMSLDRLVEVGDRSSGRVSLRDYPFEAELCRELMRSFNAPANGESTQSSYTCEEVRTATPVSSDFSMEGLDF